MDIDQSVVFRYACSLPSISVARIMKFLRRSDQAGFRIAIIKKHVPAHLQEQSMLQCKLEGLI